MSYILQFFLFSSFIFCIQYAIKNRSRRDELKTFFLISLLLFILSVLSVWVLEFYFFLFFIVYLIILIFIGQRNYYNLKIKNINLQSSKVQKDYSIAFISDFHYDIRIDTFNEKAMKKLINSIPIESIDLLLLGGDYVNYKENIDIFIKYLKEISIRVPTIAIYGNHDFDKIDIFDSKFKDSNIITLNNSYTAFNNDIIISGVEDLWTNNPNYKSYSNEIDKTKFNILLSHNPDYINYILDEDFDLALSGHYHAGQFNFIPKFKLASFVTKYVYGMYNINNKKLYVTSGVGGTMFRGKFSFYTRIGSNPEIVIMNIKKNHS